MKLKEIRLAFFHGRFRNKLGNDSNSGVSHVLSLEKQNKMFLKGEKGNQSDATQSFLAYHGDNKLPPEVEKGNVEYKVGLHSHQQSCFYRFPLHLDSSLSISSTKFGMLLF